MATIKVSEMTEASTFEDGDYSMIVQSNQNKKISHENMLGEMKTDISTLKSNVGTMSSLTTPVTSSLVGAINSIVDSGSNANGNYIKYSDGTMICYKTIDVSARIYKAFGNLYETENKVDFGDFAVPFIEIPQVYFACVGRTALFEGIQDQTVSSYGRMWLMRPLADANTENYRISLMAIGKWK